MRRVLFAAAIATVLLVPTIASAKLPFFGLDVAPTHADVGETITLTMTCYEDVAHSRRWSACLGTGSRMAWVHPLDDEGKLDLDDWIPVVGHATSSGATRGRITLEEAGEYDVLPLWRTWGPGHGEGFPSAIRIEVGRGRVLPMAIAAVGAAAAAMFVASRRRRAEPSTITP